jgi:hypothetical protein
MRLRLAPIALAFSLATGCGDDGGAADLDAPNPSPDAGVDAPTDAPTDASPVAPVVTITSHTDGQRITGSRTITLAGTLADTDTITGVTVTVGGAAPVTATFDQTSFSASITLGDNDNAISVTATDLTAVTGTDHVTVRFPYIALTSFQSATMVLGQATFTTGAVRAADAGRVHGTYGRPTEIAGTFYVSDYVGDRILGFRGFPAQDGANADFVLGAPNLTTVASGASATLMNGPQTVVGHGGRMYAVDYSNNRILVWNTPPTTTAAPADAAIGQASLTGNVAACTATGLDAPEEMFVVGDKLIVADADNNRVLIWNTVPTAGGVAPDLVLGQADFTHCMDDDDNQDGAVDAAPSLRTLDYPQGLWSDGTRLFVADSSNHRVLVWNTFPTSSFQPADFVLGQASASSQTTGTAADRFSVPNVIVSNGNQLFIADRSNHRVKIWNQLPTSNVAADLVLGQGDFTHVASNDDNQDGTSDAAPSNRTFRHPPAVWIERDRLFVSDGGNNRVLLFGTPVCTLNAGLFEFPAGSGTCIDDPCVPSTCTNQRTCDRTTGAAVCSCPGGWVGDCNQCVRYVDSAATGFGTGLTWSDANTSVASAADAAYTSGLTCEVWVKEGTHYLYRTTDNDTLNLRGPVTVRGGFAGNETTAAGRSGGESILDGRNAASGTSDVYHVVTSNSAAIAGTPAIDRLTIRLGNANGTGNNNLGGGVFVGTNADLTITDCVIEDNRATTNGAGIFVQGGASAVFAMSGTTVYDNAAGGHGGGAYLTTFTGTATITDCDFTENLATLSSGGLMSSGAVTLSNSSVMNNVAGTNGGGATIGAGSVTNTDFIGNSAGPSVGHNGGAVHLGGAGAGTFTGNRVYSNTAGGDAGGLYVSGPSTAWNITNTEIVSNRGANGAGIYFDAAGSNNQLSGCVIAGNVATGTGGGLYFRDTNPTTAISNLAIVGNVAGSNGGGLSINGMNGAFTNLIVWDNASPSSPQVRTNSFPGTITYSDVEGGFTGTGNLDAAPGFVRAPTAWDLVTAAPALDTVTVLTGAAFAVGDYVEIADDGVLRQLSAVNGNNLTFTPALAATVTNVTAQNWGASSTNLPPDFHLTAGSACDGTGTPAGTDMGAYP